VHGACCRAHLPLLLAGATRLRTDLPHPQHRHPTSVLRQASARCQGSTPANVIIESVTPLPAAGRPARIVLRNTGGQTANITGWRLSSGGANGTTDAASANRSTILYIADNVRCKPNGTVPSGQSLVFTPRSDANPCGFAFPLGPRCVCVGGCGVVCMCVCFEGGARWGAQR
jgi:hypothetical protein